MQLCDLVWRYLCLSDHKDQYGVQEVSEFDLHFPIHHAAVDSGCRMAELIQLQCRDRHIQRLAGIFVQCADACLVVRGAIPLHHRFGHALCTICLHSDRRYLQKHGRQPRRGGNDPGYTALEDLYKGHDPDGQASYPVNDPAGCRFHNRLLSGSTLLRSDDTGYQVCLHE